ncbi:hypothetical protein HanRHA438_Chr10g0457101 [Helianthus annuus]|nr:hypothetical protein HanRHA438_Chr10g0457101 [Helianthus annuus]
MGLSMRGVGRFGDFRLLPPLRTLKDFKLRNIDRLFHSLLLFPLLLQLRGPLLPRLFGSLLLLSLLLLIFLSFPFFLFLHLLLALLSLSLRLNSLRHIFLSNILLFSRLTSNSLRRFDGDLRPLWLWLSKLNPLFRGFLLDLCREQVI